MCTETHLILIVILILILTKHKLLYKCSHGTVTPKFLHVFYVCRDCSYFLKFYTSWSLQVIFVTDILSLQDFKLNSQFQCSMLAWSTKSCLGDSSTLLREELKKVEKVQLFRDPPPFNLKLENILFLHHPQGNFFHSVSHIFRS